MPIGFVYQVIKDVAALAKMKEREPIDPGPQYANQLVDMGIIDGENAEAYSWCAPRNLFARTEAPNATHEIVWVIDGLKRTKRKVVRFTHDGNLDLVLIRRKEAAELSG